MDPTRSQPSTNNVETFRDPAQEGIKFIQLAVAEDQKHNIPEAIKFYELGIYFLTLAYQRNEAIFMMCCPYLSHINIFF
jgi:hypothetical protein